jgi:hypothetical protein
VHRVHQERKVGHEFRKHSCRGQAIHHGHDQVQNDEIGIEFLSLGDYFLAILSVDHLPGVNPFQQLVQGSSNHRIIFGNQDSDRHANARVSRDGASIGLVRKCVMPYKGIRLPEFSKYSKACSG